MDLNSPQLTDELRRFINTIASIPHLEAMLLLRETCDQMWDETVLSQRLYMSRETAINMLRDLCAAGISTPAPDASEKFIYAPAYSELGELIEQLAQYYPRNLIEVTNMIHSRTSTERRVKMFADAFKFKKEK